MKSLLPLQPQQQRGNKRKAKVAKKIEIRCTAKESQRSDLTHQQTISNDR
jgi:hypothetical protein